MGQAFVLRGRFELSKGLDASEAQDRAVSVFEKTLDLDPSLASGFRNLGRAALARADAQARRGLDPTNGLDQVRRFIEQLAGDRTLPARVDALGTLRDRLASSSIPKRGSQP
jgi:hypothetical protein